MRLQSDIARSLLARRTTSFRADFTCVDAIRVAPDHSASADLARILGCS